MEGPGRAAYPASKSPQMAESSRVRVNGWIDVHAHFSLPK
jgi:hypothetical protein